MSERVDEGAGEGESEGEGGRDQLNGFKATHSPQSLHRRVYMALPSYEHQSIHTTHHNATHVCNSVLTHSDTDQ